MCYERSSRPNSRTGFSGNKTQMGVKMSKTVKAQGCSNLKTLIEDDKLLVRDYNIVAELTTFIQNKQSFEIDEGYHDDLVVFSYILMVSSARLLQRND